MNIDPYLIFNGNCEAAFKDYQRILGGNIVMLSRFGEAPDAGDMPPEAKDLVMHVRLDVDGRILMASDTHPSMPHQGNHGFSLALGFTDVAQGERVFNALAEGGSVTMPLQKTFWAESFGMLVDRHGIAWMVNSGETM